MPFQVTPGYVSLAPNGPGGNARKAGNRGNHHARQKLHGGDVLMIERIGRRGQDFEDSERAMQLPQRRGQDRADSQPFAGEAVHVRILFGIIAEHDLSRAEALGRNAGIGLEPDAEIGSGATCASAANDLAAVAQSEGSARGSGEDLGTLGNDPDGGLELDLRNRRVRVVHFCVFIRARVMPRGKIGMAHRITFEFRARHGVEQFAHQPIQLVIVNHACRSLSAQGSAQQARQAEYRFASAGQAASGVIGADEFALRAKDGSRQG